MWRQCACLQCSCACLSTSFHCSLRILLAVTIYWAHTIAGQSVLAPSPPAYLVGLTTACMYMYVLFTLIQFWSVPAKSGSMTSSALYPNPHYRAITYYLNLWRTITYKMQCINWRRWTGGTRCGVQWFNGQSEGSVAHAGRVHAVRGDDVQVRVWPSGGRRVLVHSGHWLDHWTHLCLLRTIGQCCHQCHGECVSSSLLLTLLQLYSATAGVVTELQLFWLSDIWRSWLLHVWCEL